MFQDEKNQESAISFFLYPTHLKVPERQINYRIFLIDDLKGMRSSYRHLLSISQL